MKRISFKQAGYDCRYALCQHEPKGGHGIDGGKFCYVVVSDEGDLAMSLAIYSSEWPETIPLLERQRLLANDLEDLHLGLLRGNMVLHSAGPLEALSEYHDPGPGRDCEHLPGGKCWTDWSWSDRHHAWLPTKAIAFNDKGLCFEQPEAFWLKLEEAAQASFPAAREAMAQAAQVKMCPMCHGARAVPAETPNPGLVLRAFLALYVHTVRAVDLFSRPDQAVFTRADKLVIRCPGAPAAVPEKHTVKFSPDDEGNLVVEVKPL